MSAKGRFVLYHRGGKPGVDAQARLRATQDLRVLDEASPRLLLVECSESTLRQALRNLNGWSWESEQEIRAGSGLTLSRFPDVENRAVGGDRTAANLIQSGTERT